MEPFFTSLRGELISSFDSFFILTGNIFVFICLALIVSPMGKVRIGGMESTPDFSYPAWFSMLFAAGMGIGLVFFGVSEPMSHFNAALTAPIVEGGLRTDWAPLAGASGNVNMAVEQAMAGTIYHWALHPWSIYALLALGLALFSYNKGLPLTLRSIFYPLLGERIWGWPGHIIDILAVMATVFGLATSLGFGASQASTGLNYLFDTPTGLSTEVILIFCITMLALISVVAGLDKGVKVLSELNMLLAVLLLIFVVCVGLQLDVFKSYADNLTAYAKHFIDLSTPFSREDKNFSQGWTAFKEVTSFIGIVLVVVFFVTSSDSGALVVDTIAAGGKAHSPLLQRIFWCLFEGIVAISLMLGGGLIATQAMVVSTGLPFAVVLLVAVFSLIKGLWRELKVIQKHY